MSIVPIKTPAVIKKMFPNHVWDIATVNKELYLTFDDGPTPEITNWTLDILDQYHAKASFFCIGDNVKKYPSIFKRILSKGHAIGNHTQNHFKGWSTKTQHYLDNVKKAEATINTLLDNENMARVSLFRPPYGQIKPQQSKKIRDLGYQIIMWDVLSFDWEKGVSEAQCLNNIISKSKPGSIIVFHDSLKASKNMMYALPKVLAFFSNQGFIFKPLY